MTTTFTDQKPAVAAKSTPVVTPDPKPTCSVARFGKPHAWTTGAFYWPLGSSQLYVGEDFVMCGGCGQIEAN